MLTVAGPTHWLWRAVTPPVEYGRHKGLTNWAENSHQPA